MARVNDLLATLLIEEIAAARGVGRYKYSDRLTRQEAREIIAWARTQPELVRAYADRGSPHYETVRLYHQMLTHFAEQHPQDAAGKPAAWPARGDRPPAQDNSPFRIEDGGFFPDEAEAWLAWAQTRPEYHEALADRGHARHREIVDTKRAALAVAGAEPAPTMETAPAPAPLRAAASTPGEVAALMQDQAFLAAWTDKNHPEHAAAVARRAAAFERAFPAGDAAPAAGSLASGRTSIESVGGEGASTP